MTWVLLGLLAVVAYLRWGGPFDTRARYRVGAVVAGALALRFGLTGNMAVAGGLGTAAALLWNAGEARGGPRGGSARARALLGVSEDAGPDEVRAAHRRLAAGAHPDRGGSTAAMQELNWARDLLLRRARARSRG